MCPEITFRFCKETPALVKFLSTIPPLCSVPCNTSPLYSRTGALGFPAAAAASSAPRRRPNPNRASGGRSSPSPSLSSEGNGRGGKRSNASTSKDASRLQAISGNEDGGPPTMIAPDLDEPSWLQVDENKPSWLLLLQAVHDNHGEKIDNPSNGVSTVGYLRPAFREESYLRSLFHAECNADGYSSDWREEYNREPWPTSGINGLIDGDKQRLDINDVGSSIDSTIYKLEMMSIELFSVYGKRHAGAGDVSSTARATSLICLGTHIESSRSPSSVMRHGFERPGVPG